jgi:hypothetical protein
MKTDLTRVSNETFARSLLDADERHHDQAFEIAWKIDQTRKQFNNANSYKMNKIDWLSV